MKIAVVGAGLAGLAFAWHYHKLNPSMSVTLFDPSPAHLRTSALANLLYPHAGLRSKLNWQGLESFFQSIDLLKEIQIYSTQPLYRSIPLLKLAYTSDHVKEFKKAAEQTSSFRWNNVTPYPKPGLWIDPVVQVNGQEYLIALEKALLNQGLSFERRWFAPGEEQLFDQVIYATGFHSKELWPNLPFNGLKGQALILKWPQHFLLDHCVIGDKLHVIPSFDQKTLYIGNTFEREFLDSKPSLEVAKKLLWQGAKTLFPKLQEEDIIQVQSGVRLNIPGYLPLLEKLNRRCWLFTALGSKGLLYHAYLAKILANAVTQNDPSLIPSLVSRQLHD